MDLWLVADMAAVRAKSLALGDLFMVAMAPLRGAYGFRIVSEADPAQRGSQIAYAHPQGYAIIQALRELDVVADFRTPDVLRFGLTPLTLRYADIVETVRRIEQVCAERMWDKPHYHQRAAVT